MSKVLNENMVLQILDEGNKRIRIIFIDTVYIYYVTLNKDTSMPKKVDITTIESELENNKIVKVKDPYLMSLKEEDIVEKHRVKRNKDWEFVDRIWTKYKEDLLNKSARSKIIKKVSKEYNLKILKIKRLLTRFWQRGMTKNAMLPDYMNSGAKGRSRQASEKKRGRPRKANYNGNVIKGINVDEDIKDIFEASIQRFYRTNKKKSLKETYNEMLKKFFSNKIKVNNEEVIKIWDESRIPTYHQFYYWFNKTKDIKKDIEFRESTKSFELNNRVLLKNSKIETEGPGSRYQIDATIGDIYLISSINRNRIIGRPVIYAVLDVFSRLITGIYVGLEGPSWIGAMMALDNVVDDKVEFCKKYDIDIDESIWPCRHLPETIIADRGEFEGYNVQNIINNLNIRIENTPPYRGDLKGIVERHFRTTNDKVKHKTPGAIAKEFRERGDRDYRLDATLTLEEFIQIYIRLVLHHNQKIIEKYPMEKEMITDEITPTPLNLWNWGIANRKGGLRRVDRDIVRLNLLPRGKASISRAGLKFKKMYYSSQKAVENQWFINSKKRWIEVAYDPRNMDYIYIPDENGMEFSKCYLLEKSYTYKGNYLEEIVFQEELKNELTKLELNRQNQNIADLDNEIDSIISKAENEKNKSRIEKQSKSSQLKNIRKNRSIEKEINRENESFELGKEEEKEGTLTNINKNKYEDNEEPKTLNKLQLLKKKRDEKLGKKE